MDMDGPNPLAEANNFLMNNNAAVNIAPGSDQPLADAVPPAEEEDAHSDLETDDFDLSGFAEEFANYVSPDEEAPRPCVTYEIKLPKITEFSRTDIHTALATLPLRLVTIVEGLNPIGKATVYADDAQLALEQLKKAGYSVIPAPPSRDDAEAWELYRARSIYFLGVSAGTTQYRTKAERRQSEMAFVTWVNERVTLLVQADPNVNFEPPFIHDAHHVYNSNVHISTTFLETSSPELATFLQGKVISTPEQEYHLGHVQDEEDVLVSVKILNSSPIHRDSMTAARVRDVLIDRANSFLAEKLRDPIPPPIRVQLRWFKDGRPADPVLQWNNKEDRDRAFKSLSSLHRKTIVIKKWTKRPALYSVFLLVLRAERAPYSPPSLSLLRCGDVESNPGPYATRGGIKCTHCPNKATYYCDRCGMHFSCNLAKCVDSLRAHVNERRCLAPSPYSTQLRRLASLPALTGVNPDPVNKTVELAALSSPNITILSLNANGRLNSKSDDLRHLVDKTKPSIILFQETHFRDEVDISVLDLLLQNYSIFATPPPKSGANTQGTGLAVAISSNIAHNYLVSNISKRYQVVTAKDKSLVLHNTYFRSGRQHLKGRYGLLVDVLTQLTHQPNARHIIGGDFNFVDNPTLDAVGLKHPPRDKHLSDAFHNAGLIDTFRSEHPLTIGITRPTPNNKNEGSRLDRFYTNDTTLIGKTLIISEYVGCISDHVPVLFTTTIPLPRMGPTPTRRPARHVQFLSDPKLLDQFQNEITTMRETHSTPFTLPELVEKLEELRKKLSPMVKPTPDPVRIQAQRLYNKFKKLDRILAHARNVIRGKPTAEQSLQKLQNLLRRSPAELQHLPILLQNGKHVDLYKATRTLATKAKRKWKTANHTYLSSITDKAVEIYTKSRSIYGINKMLNGRLRPRQVPRWVYKNGSPTDNPETVQDEIEKSL
ncbi:MAG TPA: endonuclease/exonuclease/phosphatase family protein, partial [Candidatus Obscuribacterales bacterium]